MAKRSRSLLHCWLPLLGSVVLALPVALALPVVASAAPDHPKHQPTVASLQQRLGRLALQNTQVVERYNQARELASKRKAAAAHAAAEAAEAGRDFAAATLQIKRTLAAQYQGSSLTSTEALLTSENGQAYVEHLDILSLLSRQQAAEVNGLVRAKRRVDSAAASAHQLSAAADSDLAAANRDRSTVSRQIKKYRSTLKLLTAAQRADYSRGINPKITAADIALVSKNVAGSKAARLAVRFALAQVGKPYVWGAAGPAAYDCSGLTMASWAAAGVGLPHSAAEQYNHGTHVPLSALAPGDLIFMYSPIGHVTIYAGGGLMVSAPTEGQPVSVVPVSSFNGDIVGATHLA